MLDVIRNKDTKYNHLKIDTFESSISTAKDIMDIIKYAKEGKYRCLQQRHDNILGDNAKYFKFTKNPRSDDLDFYNNNIQDESAYDPLFSGGFLCYSSMCTDFVEIVQKEHCKEKLKLDFKSIELTEESFFQYSLVHSPYVVGVLFMYKYLYLHHKEDIYMDLADYQSVWEEMVELRKNA